MRTAAEDAKHALSNVTQFIVQIPVVGSAAFSLEVLCRVVVSTVFLALTATQL